MDKRTAFCEPLPTVTTPRQDSMRSRRPAGAAWHGMRAIILGWLTYGATAAGHAAPALFARLSVDREGIVRDESCVLTLAIFASGDTLGRQVSLSGMPEAAQLSVSPFEELANESSVIDGRVYEMRRYRARARASAAGTVRVAPQIQGTLVRMQRFYFMTQTQEQPVSIPVDPLTLDISDLPETGRPPGFSGVVGAVQFAARAEPLEVAPGDLVTVAMTVTGEGLPDTFVPPSVPAAPGLRAYEVRPVPAQSDASRRVFEQVVVAAEPYAKAIPAVSFSSFDPRQRRYRTHTAGPFPLAFHAERSPAGTVYHPPAVSTVSTSPAPAPAEPGRLIRLGDAIRGVTSGWLASDTPVPARFAPTEESAPLFQLKPAARFRVEEQTQGWVRVSCAQGVGWIPSRTVHLE